MTDETLKMQQAIEAADCEEIAALAQNKNCDCNIQASNGNSALMIAAAKKNIELVKILLRHGADPYLSNHAGETAFAVAYKVYDKTIFNKILSAALEKCETEESITQLLNLSESLIESSTRQIDSNFVTTLNLLHLAKIVSDLSPDVAAAERIEAELKDRVIPNKHTAISSVEFFDPSAIKPQETPSTHCFLLKHKELDISDSSAFRKLSGNTFQWQSTAI